MLGLKKQHWIAVGLTLLVFVLLFLAPNKPDLTKVNEPALSEEPPTIENQIDSALSLIASPQPMQGILMLRELAEENPANFRAQYHLGRLSAQTNQWEKVIERFTIVNQIDPDFVESNYWLGKAELNLGQKEEAKAHLEKFIEVEENNSQLRDDAETMLNELN